MNDIKWVDNHIEVAPPKRPKKITGTRLASIFGLNTWSTPFKTWCEITKTYQEPFEDTKYTLAGKAIEPKQAGFMEDVYAMTGLVRPSDIWGKDYFKKTYGDFFPDRKILGGSWDYLSKDDDGNVEMVLEMKTTQRSEDWQNGIPEYYAMQAALYAWLLEIDNVAMVCSFLEPGDYDDPDAYEVSLDNTVVMTFKVSERYPNFGELIAQAEKWWADHVETGISPDFDEKADAEILKILRTNSLNPDTDIETLIAEAEALQERIDEVTATVSKESKRVDAIKKQVREYLTGQLREGDTRAEIQGGSRVWALSRSETTKLDEEKLKADGLYDSYTKTEPSYRMTISKIKKEDK